MEEDLPETSCFLCKAPNMASPSNLKEGDFYNNKAEKDIFYIVIDSRLRKIESLKILENMIGSQEPPNVITIDADFLAKCTLGPRISDEHPLIRGRNEKVYLRDNKSKRYIISGEAFDKYHFL